MNITLEELIEAIKFSSYEVCVLTNDTREVYDGNGFRITHASTYLTIIDYDKLLENLRNLRDGV